MYYIEYKKDFSFQLRFLTLNTLEQNCNDAGSNSGYVTTDHSA